MAIISQSPATGELFAQFAELSSTELEKKLATTLSTFLIWRQTSLEERAGLMKKAAIKLREQKNSLAILMAEEMGKILKAGQAEIEKCASVCDYYADNAAKFLAPENIATEAKESFVRFDPLGAVLAVMPWNFPFWQVFRFAAPALMAGNVGLLKHASNVPRCALAIEKIFVDCGFPSGTFQTLLVGSGAVEKIVADDRVAAVTLTGSEFAGSQVAASAGKALKKCVFELGGSDPFIVLADADLVGAVKAATTARMQNNVGQSCIASKRFIVEESVVAEFTAGLVKEFSVLKIGDPLAEDTNVGPLVNENALKEIDDQVQKTLSMGAKLEFGGARVGEVGNFYLPTVVSGVTKGMPLYEEEVFGPIAPIIVVKNADEAIEIANSSVYGLGATIWTANLDKAKQMATQLESGSVYINGAMKSDVRLPFGGIKKSGFGRELGSYGIREFVNVKTVVIEK
ncbi:MAG: NAD-dependent succinate-semialdehyde dehydrogenase [Candidatus Magasanikbacteria bacterium]|nr:NAD-dependent succinate-semialdehyde dehydrogenase [Candidatus Magasanikbacteria bacterium]